MTAADEKAEAEVATKNRRYFARAIQCLNLAIQECVLKPDTRFKTDLIGLAVQYSGREIGREQFERLMAQRIDHLLWAFDIRAGEYRPRGKKKP